MNIADILTLVNVVLSPTIVVLLILTQTLVPGYLFKKSEENNETLMRNLELQRSINAELTAQVTNSNQLIGALRQEAQMRQIEYGGHHIQEKETIRAIEGI